MTHTTAASITLRFFIIKARARGFTLAKFHFTLAQINFNYAHTVWLKYVFIARLIADKIDMKKCAAVNFSFCDKSGKKFGLGGVKHRREMKLKFVSLKFSNSAAIELK